MFDLRNRSVLFDVDLGRDIADPLSVGGGDTFIDDAEVTWTVGESTQLVKHRSGTRIDPSDADELWTPIVGIRDLEILPQTSTGEPRIQFVDHTAPLGVGLTYRVRAIQERAPFDIQSSRWGQTGPVLVSANRGGWLSTIDGSSRFALNPRAISWGNDLPNQVGAGIGTRGHVVTRDVRKAADMSVTVDTYDSAEHDAYLDLVESGDPLWLADVHGRVFLVQPVDTLTFEPERALPTARDTGPVRHLYRVTTRMIEVQDPRDFGYGCSK